MILCKGDWSTFSAGKDDDAIVGSGLHLGLALLEYQGHFHQHKIPEHETGKQTSMIISRKS